MNILLLNPPYVKGFMRNARWEAITIAGSEWLPIWLAYATGVLEKNGHNAVLLDANIENLSLENLLGRVDGIKPDLTVIYNTMASLDNDIFIANKIKEKGSSIVFVGPWCSINPDDILTKSKSIDFLIDGEFDYPLLDLVNNVQKEKINGLYWKENNGKIHKNEKNAYVPKNKMDELPFVSEVYKNHIDIRKYFQAAHLHPFTDLFTGRGCSWGKCTFCLWPFTISRGAGYRTRSIKNVIEEIRYIKKFMPWTKEIFIQDDTLPSWRAEELADALIENKIDIKWSCYARADATMTLRVLSKMKKSGCRLMHVGYETHDRNILKNICKGTTPETMEQFTKNANKVNIMIHADFITGLPGENRKTIIDTVRWAKRLNVHSYQFTIPKPYPGTPFYDTLKKKGWIVNEKIEYPELSQEDIKKYNIWALKNTNLNPKYILRMLRRPGEWYRLLRAARYTIPHIIKG